MISNRLKTNLYDFDQFKMLRSNPTPPPGQPSRERRRVSLQEKRSGKPKEKTPEPIVYEPSEVMERTAMSYRSKTKTFMSEEHRKKLAECGWSSKKFQPFKPLGDPILDPKVIENMRKGNKIDTSENDLFDDGSPTNLDGHSGSSNFHFHLFDNDQKTANGYALIRKKLTQAESRLRGVKAGIRYLDLVPAANFVDEVKTIGTQSMKAKDVEAEILGGTAPQGNEFFLTSTPHGHPASQMGTTPHHSMNVSGTPGTPLKPETPDGNELFKTLKVPVLPIKRSGSSVGIQGAESARLPISLQESDDLKEDMKLSQSARDVDPKPPQSANGRSRDSRRGSRSSRAELQSARSSALHEILTHGKNTPLDPSYSVSSTKKDFYSVKKTMNDKLEADLTHVYITKSEHSRMEEERPSTFRRKFAALSPEASAMSSFDANSELTTMRLKAEKEKYLSTVRYNSRNQWFVTLLSIVHEGDRKLTDQESHFMHILSRLVAEGVSISAVDFYGIVKMLPAEYHLSEEIQKIFTFIRQDHLKIPVTEYKAWLIANGYPVPESVQVAASKATKGRRRNDSFYGTPSRSAFTPNPTNPETPRHFSEFTRVASSLSNHNLA